MYLRKIEMFDLTVFVLDRNKWNHLTVTKKKKKKKAQARLKILIIYLVYKYKKDFALHNLQSLICHKLSQTYQPFTYKITPNWMTMFNHGHT